MCVIRFAILLQQLGIAGVSIYHREGKICAAKQQLTVLGMDVNPLSRKALNLIQTCRFVVYKNARPPCGRNHTADDMVVELRLDHTIARRILNYRCIALASQQQRQRSEQD